MGRGMGSLLAGVAGLREELGQDFDVLRQHLGSKLEEGPNTLLHTDDVPGNETVLSQSKLASGGQSSVCSTRTRPLSQDFKTWDSSGTSKKLAPRISG